jgi:hypothetical protein
MKAVSRGYLSLAESDVSLDPWSLSLDGGEPQIAPESLDDWSYYQSLNIRVAAVADLQALLGRLDLAVDSQLGLVILWVSPGTSLRGSSEVVVLEPNETSVELDLEGALLRGDLRLECQIVLVSSPSKSSSALAPQEPGSVVWSSTHAVRLEGSGSRMPVVSIAFSQYFASQGNHALWWLQVAGADLYAPADSLLWMWLNEENPIVAEMLTDASSAPAARTQQFLKIDFYRQLIQLGLSDPDFSPDKDYPVGSLGAVISAPMSLLGDSYSDVRAKHANDPQLLDAEIQARLGGL